MSWVPRISCAICNREVDDVETSRNDLDDTWILRVRCHGDADTMIIGAADLNDPALMTSLREQQGVAFSAARIAPKAPTHDR